MEQMEKENIYKIGYIIYNEEKKEAEGRWSAGAFCVSKKG